MNSSNKSASALLMVALCLTTVEAQACGEVMLRTLGAMRYHPYVTKHPAAIVLYFGEAGLKYPPEYAAKLHDSLEKVGHKVLIARGAGELAQALAAHHQDLIITYVDDMDRVTTEITKGPLRPTLIPVLDNGAPNERQVRERFPGAVGTFREMLKTIERSMGPRT